MRSSRVDSSYTSHGRRDFLRAGLYGLGSAVAVPLDVTSADSVSSALDTVEAELGTVTVLVNNAGVADSRYCLNVDEASWDYVMETNLKGAWRVARAVAGRCVEAECPASIVNVASIVGLRVAFGESTYGASKAGLVQLTRAMALELGRKGIRVNAICPGYFSTEMNADYLASEEGEAMLHKSPFRRAGESRRLCLEHPPGDQHVPDPVLELEEGIVLHCPRTKVTQLGRELVVAMHAGDLLDEVDLPGHVVGAESRHPHP